MTRRFRFQRLDARRMVTQWPLLTALLLAMAIAGIGGQIFAQEHPPDWATPVNLSQSGMASSPAIVLLPDGTLRIFWWDQFDGTMVIDGALVAPTGDEIEARTSAGEPVTPTLASDAWSAPRLATVRTPSTIRREGEEVIVLTPVETAPRIVGDRSGRAHAFWLGEPDIDTGDTPLLYSFLNPDSTSWSTPSNLSASASSFAAAPDSTGAVHLVYVQARPTAGSPVGLHHRQLPADGSSWSTPVVVHGSRYLRLLAPDEDPLRLTADDEGNLYAAWKGLDQKQVLLTHSSDGGATWSEPEVYLGSGVQPERDRVLALPGSASAVLWVPASEPSRRIAASSSGNGLDLAAWDGVRWSEAAKDLLNLEDPASGEQVHLHDLNLVLVPASADEEEAAKTLAVMGFDDSGDLWITGARVSALEQLLARPADEDELSGTGAPANLSQSGGASDPAIVAKAGDRLYAFWLDQFDGLTVADALVTPSTVLSGTEEIRTSREIWSEPRALPLLLPEMAGEGGEPDANYAPEDGVPKMVADATGGIHAFWLMEPAGVGPTGEEVAARRIMHSQLAPDASAWSWPTVLAESTAAFDVAADGSGALHIAYSEIGNTPSSPSGIYYRRMEPSLAHWTAPIALQQSRYFRLLTPEAAHLRLAADETGSVYVTWDDPQQGGLWLANSPDSGTMWQGPTAVGSAGEQSQRGRLITVPQGEALLLWQSAGSAGPCRLVQATVRAIIEGSIDTGRPVLEGLEVCPKDEKLLPLGEGQVLMALGSGTDALTFVVWDGSAAAGTEEGQWSEPSRLAFSFEDPKSARRIYLGDLQIELVEIPAPTAQELPGRALVAVGTDQQGDIWATSSEAGALDLVFAEASPWSLPANVSLSEAHPELPAVVADDEGQVHALWTEGGSAAEPAADLVYARWDGKGWTSPVRVLGAPEDGAWALDLVAQGDRLHAVWSNQDGEILHSYAFAQDAYAAEDWSEPRLLSEESSFASEPDLAADAAGGLHAVYAVPVNEGRGIYYTRSDGGEAWTPPRQVFDASEAGKIATGQPQLAVDAHGFVHVAWVRIPLSDHGLPEGIYYARSMDGGQTWSEPQDMATGAYGSPQLVAAAEGRVHLVWQEVNGQGTWLHRYSSDAGATWTGPERIAGFGAAEAPLRLMVDNNGALHLVGLEIDEEGVSSLLYTTWDGGHWSSPEAYRLGVDGVEAGIGAAIAPALHRLDILFRGESSAMGEDARTDLWHTGRTALTVAVTPAPAFVPQPTATHVPTPTPTATAEPTPNLNGVSPATNGGTDSLLPILLAGGGALLIVVAAAGTSVLRARRR